jgi:hypothetical protein
MQLMKKKTRNLKMKFLVNSKPIQWVPNDDINLLPAQGTTSTAPFIAGHGTPLIGPVAATTDPTIPATMAPTVAATTGTARAPTAVPMSPVQTSRGSISARTLVSPYERRGSNKSNPQHEGLIQMMQISMLQHILRPVHVRGAHAPRWRTREDHLVMQQILANAVGRAVAAMKKFMNNKEE